MTAAEGRAGLRVERALRLLPDIDALVPLRAFLVSSSRDRESGEPYRTVGKRLVPSAELKEYAPRAVERASEHLTALYQAAVEALQAEERGDEPAAVRALLAAGKLEERVGRLTQARAWYEHALRIAEELRDRRPEMETLLHLGHLDADRGSLDSAGRHYQRSLALAEAELSVRNAALACQGLGRVASALGKWSGAAAWFTRALDLAKGDRQLIAKLQLALAEVAGERGRPEEAEESLTHAGRLFDELGDADGSGRVLAARGRIEARRERHAEALIHYREALARLHDAGAPRELEMEVRLNLCELYLEWDRLPDAEDETRHAEELAIMQNLTHQLARLYVLMGKLRGRQRDETGFVFFEKAVELCRGREPSPRLEAEIYLEYALYRRAFGEIEESRAYLERAREVFEAVGDASTIARVDAELSHLPPQPPL